MKTLYIENNKMPAPLAHAPFKGHGHEMECSALGRTGLQKLRQYPNIFGSIASRQLFLCVASFLLACNLSQASVPVPSREDDAKLREAMASLAGPSYSVAAPPTRGVVVSPGIATCVLLQSANPSSDVLLRITSGPLRGSIVNGSYSDNKMVFINIENIKTPYGTDVWMPITKGADCEGVVDIPRVQVDRSEWTVVKNGGTLSAGTTVHLRILDDVQFDAPSEMPTVLRLAQK